MPLCYTFFQIGLIKDSSVNEAFLAFERLYKRFEKLQDINEEEIYSSTGSGFQVNQMVGSYRAIFEGGYVPQKYKLSDEEVLQVITSHEFYVHTSAQFDLKKRMWSLTKHMKTAAEQILTALELLN